MSKRFAPEHWASLPVWCARRWLTGAAGTAARLAGPAVGVGIRFMEGNCMNYRTTVVFLATTSLLTMPLVAKHNDQSEGPEREFRADLRGRNEVPLTLSGARGTLSLTVKDDDSSAHFVLEYSGLQTPVAAAHIHVGQPNVNGGVTVFFCGTVPAGFPTRAACPQAGTVTGDFTAADVIGL